MIGKQAESVQTNMEEDESPPSKAPGPLTLATPLPTALAAPGGMAGDHASAGN